MNINFHNRYRDFVATTSKATIAKTEAAKTVAANKSLSAGIAKTVGDTFTFTGKAALKEDAGASSGPAVAGASAAFGSLTNGSATTVDPTVGYTLVDGCAYTKDGTTYYLNNKTKKMETKEERIDSSLGMIKEYLTDLHTKLPNNTYVTKLFNLITEKKDEIKDDISTTAGVDIPGFGKVGGFGGLGKITIADEAFNYNDISSTAAIVLHEMVHYSDNDNITSKTEEMDASALQYGMTKFFGSGGLSDTQKDDLMAVFNKGYAVDLKEGSQHKLNDATMDELREYLGFGEAIQAKLKDDNLLNSVSGGFIDGAGTVLGAGVAAGGAVGALFGKKGEAVGRVVGGVIAAIPAVAVGIVVGVGAAVVTAAKSIWSGIKSLFKKK